MIITNIFQSLIAVISSQSTFFILNFFGRFRHNLKLPMKYLCGIHRTTYYGTSTFDTSKFQSLIYNLLLTTNLQSKMYLLL